MSAGASPAQRQRSAMAWMNRRPYWEPFVTNSTRLNGTAAPGPVWPTGTCRRRRDLSGLSGCIRDAGIYGDCRDLPGPLGCFRICCGYQSMSHLPEHVGTATRAVDPSGNRMKSGLNKKVVEAPCLTGRPCSASFVNVWSRS